MGNIFKIGERVVLVSRGTIEWEGLDYTTHLSIGKEYIVQGSTAIGVIVERENNNSSLIIHPGHFRKSKKDWDNNDNNSL